MKTERIFNKRIEKFIKEQPDASVTHFIQRIMRSSNPSKDYYLAIKDLADKVGLRFFIEEVNKGKYLPCFEYDKNGLLKGEIIDSEKEYLMSEVTPMSFEGGITYLAKEVVYKLKDVKNIEKMI